MSSGAAREPISLSAPLQDLHAGVAEAVDGLLVVAHHEDGGPREPARRDALHFLGGEPHSRGPGSDDRAEQVPLVVARVVELVEEQMVIAGFETEAARRELSETREQAGGGERQVVEVHDPPVRLEPLVFRLDRPEESPDRIEGPLVQEVEPKGSERLDPPGHGDVVLLQFAGKPARRILASDGEVALERLPVQRVPAAFLFLEPEGQADRQRHFRRHFQPRKPVERCLPETFARGCDLTEEGAEARRRGGLPVLCRRFLLKIPPPGESPGEVSADRLYDLAAGAAEQQGQGTQHVAIEAGDSGEDPPDGVLAHHRHRPFVQDLDAGTHPGIERELADQPEGEGVERRDVHFGNVGPAGEGVAPVRLPQFADDPVLHLLRGLPREGEGEDVPGRRSRLDQRHVAVGQHRRLPGSGRRPQHDVSPRVGGGAPGLQIGRERSARGVHAVRSRRGLRRPPGAAAPAREGPGG